MADYGNLKPDDDLTDVFTKVAKDVAATDYGSVKAGTNTALLTALYVLEIEDPDAVHYHLSRNGYESVDDLRDAVHDRQATPFIFDIHDTLHGDVTPPEDGGD